MLVLVVDTSTPAITAAIVHVGAGEEPVTLAAERVSVDARAHGELLGPGIEAVLIEADARPADLAAIVAGLGPGPYTGLRVGLVTAAVVGQTLGVATYGVCSLDGLGADTTGRVLVATDARRKEIYWAIYQDGDRVRGPEVSRPGDVRDRLVTGELIADVAVGDGAALVEPALPVRAEPRYPQSTVLCGQAAARVRSGAPSETLTPLYLRRPDAVAPGARKLVGT